MSGKKGMIRRTQAQMQADRDTIVAVLTAEHPVTLRRLLYKLMSDHGAAKTDYVKVGKMLCKLRQEGIVPWDWVIDNTRRMEVPTTFTSVAHGLRTLLNVYRRDPWLDQDCLVFAMSEKDAIAGILREVARPLCVPICVVRGQSSQTFLHDIAEIISGQDKPAYFLYFGDHDQAGYEIEAAAEKTIRELATPGAEIYFKRLAVTAAQIKKFNLKHHDAKPRDITSTSHCWLAQGTKPPCRSRPMIAPSWPSGSGRRSKYSNKEGREDYDAIDTDTNSSRRRFISDDDGRGVTGTRHRHSGERPRAPDHARSGRKGLGGWS